MDQLNYKERLEALRKGGFTDLEISRLSHFRQGYVANGKWSPSRARGGLRLQDIHTKIHLWHSEQNSTVPAKLARYVARTLPDCEPRFYPGEGHTLSYHYWREILAVAVS